MLVSAFLLYIHISIEISRVRLVGKSDIHMTDVCSSSRHIILKLDLMPSSGQS